MQREIEKKSWKFIDFSRSLDNPQFYADERWRIPLVTNQADGYSKGKYAKKFSSSDRLSIDISDQV